MGCGCVGVYVMGMGIDRVGCAVLGVGNSVGGGDRRCGGVMLAYWSSLWEKID